ncbi:MAG: hypothetical protein J6A60_02025 [Clostridia bacterium]|nr:hypothetical protein [Clostridia bacterium]
MKKALAIVLTLVMTFSMTAMAFAETAETGTDIDITINKAVKENLVCGYCGTTFDTEEAVAAHEAACSKKPAKTCPYCGVALVDEALYNEHVNACEEDNDYINLTLKDIIDAIIAILESENGQWNDIESIITKLIDLLQNGIAALSEAEVKGLVADLEGILGDSDLLTALKEKIKNLYAGDICEDPTEAETAPDTGSSVAGIAAFAAVSVAAAAAFVCTKKRA